MYRRDENVKKKVGKLQRKRPHGRPEQSWIDIAQHRLLWMWC